MKRSVCQSGKFISKEVHFTDLDIPFYFFIFNDHEVRSVRIRILFNIIYNYIQNLDLDDLDLDD